MPRMRAVRGTPFEQALLASRWLHVVNDRLWSDFPRYWMAFNALYNAVAKDGEPEAMAVERVINFFFDPNAADECVKAIGDAAIAELTAVRQVMTGFLQETQNIARRRPILLSHSRKW